jgi:predicted metalloprotease with PDZ domain
MVEVAIHTGFNSRSRDLLGMYSFNAFDYVFKLFKVKVLDRYLVVFVPLADDGARIMGLLEASDSQGIGLASDFQDGLIGEFTHRVFHSWNAFPPFGMSCRSSEELWFAEGTNVYYDDKVKRDLGIIDDSVFLQYEARFYLDEVVGTKDDVPLASTSLDQGYPLWRLPYWKGALVSFLLDELTGKLTGGAHSLDDVLAVAYERYGRIKGVYSNEDIIKIVNSVGSFDFKPFFARYIYGKDRLPLEVTSGRVVVDWLRLLRALKLSRFPIMTLTFSDSFPKVGQTVSMTAQLVTVDSKPIVN